MSSGQDWTTASAPGGIPKITSIFDFSAEALGQLKVWLEQSGLSLPQPSFQIPVITTSAFASISARHNQQILLEIDSANAIYWQMRYNANSTSTHKWEYLAGSPLYSKVDTSESTDSTSYVDLATVGPSGTIPRSGDYLVSYGVRFGDVNHWASVKFGSAATSDTDGINLLSSAAISGIGNSRLISKTGLSTSDVVKVQSRSNDGVSHPTSHRWLSIIPIRIS